PPRRPTPAPPRPTTPGSAARRARRAPPRGRAGSPRGRRPAGRPAARAAPARPHLLAVAHQSPSSPDPLVGEPPAEGRPAEARANPDAPTVTPAPGVPVEWCQTARVHAARRSRSATRAGRTYR